MSSGAKARFKGRCPEDPARQPEPAVEHLRLGIVTIMTARRTRLTPDPQEVPPAFRLSRSKQVDDLVKRVREMEIYTCARR
jgi:hypothetical protein